jgi:hypothetical protein
MAISETDKGFAQGQATSLPALETPAFGLCSFYT